MGIHPVIEQHTQQSGGEDGHNDLEPQIPCLLLLGGLIFGLGAYLLSLPEIKNQKIRAEQERLLKERTEVFRQFLKKQVPLNGVLQKGLRGNPEAFPQDVSSQLQKVFPSSEPKVKLTVHSIGNDRVKTIMIIRHGAGLSLRATKNLVDKTPPFTISVPESMASEIQSELKNAGATVTRQS